MALAISIAKGEILQIGDDILIRVYKQQGGKKIRVAISAPGKKISRIYTEETDLNKIKPEPLGSYNKEI